METKKKIKIIEGRTWNEHVAFLKTLSPEERKERDRKKALDYQKEWQAKQRNKDFKIEVTTEDFNQLIEATTVGLVHEKNPEYVRRAQVAKANKETKLAAKTTPIVTTSSIGTLESLLNDLSTLKNKKEEILNHLESIKQLINQF